jgi:hypothetical protein
MVLLGETTGCVKTHQISAFGKQRRPASGFLRTAAPIGASVFRAGDMMELRLEHSDFKTSHHYLAGLPQRAFAGVTTTEAYYTPGFCCGRSGD